MTFEYQNENAQPKIDVFQQSVTLIEPGEKLRIFLSNDWIQIENSIRSSQKLTIELNETNLLFNEEEMKKNSSFIRIGLNRDLDGKQSGIGLCSANLTFIECLSDRGLIILNELDRKRRRRRRNVLNISLQNRQSTSTLIKKLSNNAIKKIFIGLVS